MFSPHKIMNTYGTQLQEKLPQRGIKIYSFVIVSLAIILDIRKNKAYGRYNL
jgi:predicted membrane chloride channel (bestrophin family)